MSSNAQVPTSAYTIFQSTDVPAIPLNNDGQGGIEVGLKFRASQNGTIYGIRFYKGSGSGDDHVGNLWSSSGTLLATVNFTNETSSGWQEALFSQPVAITAATTYVVSYFSPDGDYASTDQYFASQPKITNALEAIQHGGNDGPNGVYNYTTLSAFPTNGSNGDNYWVDIIFDQAGGGGTIDGETDYIAKFTSASTLGKSIMFDNGTSVGIGTLNINAAGYRLFVDDGIRTQKVRVDIDNWPDYVFDSKYKLPSLVEVEKFIKENQHLPGIPSARLVQQEGIDVGEQQALLLKKIEELTLYIIEQNKKYEALRKEMDALKSGIK